MRLPPPSLASLRLRLALQFALLAGLVVFGFASGSGLLGFVRGSGGAAAGERCASWGAPSTATVSRTQLLRLREGIGGVVDGRAGRIYEQGLVPSEYFWSDGEPGGPQPPRLEPRERGGYEIRWWLAGRDDLVADVLAFPSRAVAADFFRRASSTTCRDRGTAYPAPFPAGGRNLAWRNPDGFAQEDLFLLRGRLVYRVAVVQAGPYGRRLTLAAEGRGFLLANAFGCRLPHAGCGSPARTSSIAA